MARYADVGAVMAITGSGFLVLGLLRLGLGWISNFMTPEIGVAFLGLGLVDILGGALLLGRSGEPWKGPANPQTGRRQGR